MCKEIKEIERNYQLINEIINSTGSHLIKKLLLDNIIETTSKHDFTTSNLFYNYLKRGIIDYKDKNVSKYKQNQSNLNKKSAKMLRFFRFGIRLILKPKNIWNMVNTIEKKIILIYVPSNPRDLDLVIPIYEKIKNTSEFTPLLLYHWREGKFCENNYKQINLFDYSIRVNQLCKILKNLIMTKKAISKEKKYKDFYSAMFKIIWKTQLTNLIYGDLFRSLIENTNKIKAILFCIPSNFTRVSSEIAREFDIPTFSSIGGPIQYSLELKFVNTEYILAKGEQEKETYIKLGFDKNKVNVVGTPFLRETITNRSTMNEQIIIFYIDQPFTQYCSINCKRKIISCIGKTLKNFPNLRLLIKLHPKSKYHENIYIEEFQRIGFSNYIIYKLNYDLNKVLDISDYAIMHNSTVGLNVLFRNKPLIVLSNSFFEIDISSYGENLFFNERIAFTIRNEQDLQDIFTRISKGKLKRKNYEDIKSFLKYYVKYTGEEAAEHIVRFIESKIDESEIGGIK